MAFIPRNLSVHAYSNGLTMWAYKSTDDLDIICGDGSYFNEAFDMLNAQDTIIVTTPTRGRIVMVTLGYDKTVVVVPLS